MDRLGALLVLALSVYAASAQTLTSSGSTEANEGDTVELVCRVSGLSFVSQQLKWAKVDNQDPQLTRELSSHLSVVHRPGHYKVVAVEESGDLIYTFSINGVEKSDDGRYKCFVEENAEMIAETSEVVTVRQPIESVELFVGPFQVDASSPDPQEFELDTFEPDLVIRCKVKGSNPAAEVKVMVGEMDITAELKRSDQAMYTGPSLESIRTYNTDLDSTAVYPLDQSVIGKVISCSAWLQGDEANVKAAKAQLTVKDTTPVTRSTTSGVTTSGGTTAGRSDVVCGQEFIRTEIPAALLGQSAGEFRLEEPSCSFNVVGGKLVAQFGFNQCGTSVEFTEQAIVYRNFLTSVSTGEAVPIICEYPRRNSVSVSYQPVQRRVRLFERSLGTIDMAMRQYTSSDFQTEVPASDFPTVVKLQKPVYLQVEATSALGSSLTVFPISCSASASASVPVSETSHPLIQKGCKKDSGVIIYPAGNGKFQFSFNAFTFASQAQVVYIHCEVLFCNARDLASKCQTDCTAPETTRTKRSSTRAGQSGHYISGGPIMLDNQASGADSSLVAVLVAVAAVSMLVAVVAVVVAGVSIRMRRSKPGLDSQE